VDYNPHLCWGPEPSDMLAMLKLRYNIIRFCSCSLGFLIGFLIFRCNRCCGLRLIVFGFWIFRYSRCGLFEFWMLRWCCILRLVFAFTLLIEQH